MDFAIPVDDKMKIKESEKVDKYLDLAKDLIKLWNRKVMVIPIAVGALGTVPKDLEKRLRELKIKRRIERPSRSKYLKESKKLKETCCHSDFSEKPPVKTRMKNS